MLKVGTTLYPKEGKQLKEAVVTELQRGCVLFTDVDGLEMADYYHKVYEDYDFS